MDTVGRFHRPCALGGPGRLYTIGFGILCVTAEVFLSYGVYAEFLKWLTLSLFTSVAVVFAVRVPWGRTLSETLVPHLALDHAGAMALVAGLGTTISPYLFFWQSSLAVEARRRKGGGSLRLAPGLVAAGFARISRRARRLCGSRLIERDAEHAALIRRSRSSIPGSAGCA